MSGASHRANKNVTQKPVSAVSPWSASDHADFTPKARSLSHAKKSAGTSEALATRDATASRISAASPAAIVGTAVIAESSIPLRPQHHRQGLQQNLRVQSQTPPFDVLEIERHIRFERRIAPRRHLPQSRHSRLYIQPPQIFRSISLDIVHRMWPRSDQTHISQNHVDELRQFVNAESPQPNSAPCNPRILLHLEKRPIAFVRAPQFLFGHVRARHHGSQFVAAKLFSFSPHAQRRIKYRPRRVHRDPKRRKSHNRQAYDQAHNSHHHIQHSLRRQTKGWNRLPVQLHYR